jgi:hypothetical protein
MPQCVELCTTRGEEEEGEKMLTMSKKKKKKGDEALEAITIQSTMLNISLRATETEVSAMDDLNIMDVHMW